MKTNRKIIALILSGMFLTYFSASFIFVPKAAGLRDLATNIVKLEANDNNVTHGMFRCASEGTEDTFKIFSDFSVSCIDSFHTATFQTRLYSLAKSPGFLRDDIYLSLRRLQI